MMTSPRLRKLVRDPYIIGYTTPGRGVPARPWRDSLANPVGLIIVGGTKILRREARGRSGWKVAQVNRRTRGGLLFKSKSGFQDEA